MSVFDLDNYTDAISDAVDAIGDAGDAIGGILKGIAPILSMVPGLGTAFGVAIYAAGAIAAKDRITDAMIGTVGAAMPAGIPQIAYAGSTAIAKDIVEGRNVWDSARNTIRDVASKAGGPAAVAAFDSAVAAASGDRVDQRLLDVGRASALVGGGPSAAAAYDAGVAIARGEGADQVCLDVARGYVRDQGGPLAIGAFDTALALAYGKTLQEAGYEGLKSLVKGNNPVEKTLEFVNTLGRARALNLAIGPVLESKLGSEVYNYVSKLGVATPVNIENQLRPIIDAIKQRPEIMNYASGQLAFDWNLEESLVRAAQSVMASGAEDRALLERLKNPVLSMGDDRGGDAPGQKERNDALAAKGYGIVQNAEDLKALRARKTFGPQLATDGKWRRGFDIGVATSTGFTEFGPSQKAVRDSLLGISQPNGFNAARDLQYAKQAHEIQAIKNAVTGKQEVTMAVKTLGRDTGTPLGLRPDVQNTLNGLSGRGQGLTASDPRASAARDTLPVPGLYRQGFYIAMGACTGNVDTTDAEKTIYNYLLPANGGQESGIAGFQVGQALAHGIARQALADRALASVSPNANAAAGQLVTSGLQGSGLSSDAKANVMGTIIQDPAARQGAQSAIAQIAQEQSKSIWTKIAEFFGF